MIVKQLLASGALLYESRKKIENERARVTVRQRASWACGPCRSADVAIVLNGNSLKL